MRLKKVNVSIENLLLDPNNPRLIELFHSETVPDDKIEAKQKGLLQRFDIKGGGTEDNGIFNTLDLFHSISKHGLVPGNLICVRKLKTGKKPEKYVVSEGNRRISTVKKILDKTSNPKFLQLDEEVKKDLQKIRVKLVPDCLETECKRSGKVCRHEQEQIDDILFTRHGTQGQMEWGAHEAAIHILNKYMSIAVSGEEPMTFQNYRVSSNRIEATRNQCCQTKKQIEDTLKTIVVYKQINEDRGEPIQGKHYSLLKRIVTTKKLAGYLVTDDNYKLATSSCEKIEKICQFGERDLPGFKKILTSDKSVTPFSRLFEYTLDENETISNLSEKYLRQVEEAELPLEDAINYITAKKKSLEFIEFLEQQLVQRDEKQDSELSYDNFSGQQADQIALEQLEQTNTFKSFKKLFPR